MKPVATRWERAAAWARALMAARWQQLLRWRGLWRPREETFHLVLATLIGAAAGLINYLFFQVTELLKVLALERPGDLVEIAEGLRPWQRLLVPLLGAVAAGLVLHWSERRWGRAGSSNLLEVVIAGDGRLPFRANLAKAASSLLSIASGASIGREGSITQLSATLASKAGQLAFWPPYRLRLLVACGAAAGMSAAYNAPIAGAVFAAQIVLGNFSMNLFAPLVCASVVAAVVSRTFFGIAPWYRVPDFEFTRLLQLPWFLVLGAAAGLLGACFLAAIKRSEAAFRQSGLPVMPRLALAGLAVGLLAMAVPEVWGNGYSVTSRILADDQDMGLSLLALLLLTKFIATACAVGAGTVGGVFTPTLFLGAALGSCFGHVVHLAGWAGELPTGAFALAGMGSVLAATTHSPLLAMIIVFEISLNYSLMPALMVACAVGTLVGRRLHPASVYTEPLREKGLAGVAESDQPGVSLQLSVGDLMREPVSPLREIASLRQIGDRFLTSPNNFLPVVDATHRLIGVVALQDLKGYLNAGAELQAVIALDVMRPPPRCLTPGEKLHDVLPHILASELRHVPVVNNLTTMRLVGAVSRAEVLQRLSEAVAMRSDR